MAAAKRRANSTVFDSAYVLFPTIEYGTSQMKGTERNIHERTTLSFVRALTEFSSISVIFKNADVRWEFATSTVDPFAQNKTRQI
jgi:hypothetical protein